MTDLAACAVTNNYRHDTCPLCHSGKLVFRGNISYSSPVLISSIPIAVSTSPELWLCRHCRSCFAQNIVDAETAQMLYSRGNGCDRWSGVPFDQDKTDDILEHMSAIFRNKGNVLDVGCNTGELLDFARKFGCRTSGVDFCSTSREILREKGHSAYETLAEATGEFDVITAFDLVEHLYDISTFLKQCREKLSPKGKLVILTGDIGSLSAVLCGSRWWYVGYPEHVVFPSKQYFKTVSGLCVEKWIRTYAASGYKKPIKQLVIDARYILSRRLPYIGLPSIGPDHILVTLKR